MRLFDSRSFGSLLTISAGLLSFFSSVASPALAVSTSDALGVSTTITADNHYGLYFGTPNTLNFVGRNEYGAGGSPGMYNWSNAESYQFTIQQGDYIYIVAWSDNFVTQSVLAEFHFSDGTTLYSGSSWEYALNFSSDMDDYSELPSNGDLGAFITGAEWNPVTVLTQHGQGAWGFIDGIGHDADWMWGSQVEFGSGFGEAQVYRTRVGEVPEPATVLLLGSGLMGGAFRLRRKPA